jgi:hypothetical protein
MTTFLDTSALLAALNEREPHHSWSVYQIEARRLKGPIIIPDIVYSEFSIGMASRANTDIAIQELALERLANSDDVLFRAGRAFKKYKERSGPKTNVLPDFLIGAIAEVSKAPLLTANSDDFIKYFPDLEIISP